MTPLMREAFPADKPLSRFLVSMAMARNDIEDAMWKAAQANQEERPEFGYRVRLVMSHFLEAADALEKWRSCSTEVREFLGQLPPDGQAALRTVGGTLRKVGKDAIDHARNHTFHYPNPSEKYESDAELIKVLTTMAESPVTLGEVEGRPDRVRYVFADEVALIVAMGRHDVDDQEAYHAQVENLEVGAAAFVNFVLVAIGQHLGHPPATAPDERSDASNPGD